MHRYHQFSHDFPFLNYITLTEFWRAVLHFGSSLKELLQHRSHRLIGNVMRLTSNGVAFRLGQRMVNRVGVQPVAGSQQALVAPAISTFISVLLSFPVLN